MTACRRQNCICFRYADIQTQRRTCTHSHTPAFICQMATCGASYCSSCHLSHSSPRGISLPQKTHLSSLALSLSVSPSHTHTCQFCTAHPYYFFCHPQNIKDNTLPCNTSSYQTSCASNMNYLKPLLKIRTNVHSPIWAQLQKKQQVVIKCCDCFCNQ